MRGSSASRSTREQLALVLRWTARLDHDAAHAAPGQRHVDDVAARQLDALGRR